MIPFNDLRPLHDSLSSEIRSAIERVVDSNWYVLGPEVEAFEAEFAAWLGAKFAVGVANGTDAIELALRAVEICPGDEVITVAHTAVPTVCAIERTGATPVLVDIDADSFTILPAAVAAALTPRTKAIVAVHLYGRPADLIALQSIADRHCIPLIEDCAQAHGARFGGRNVGTFGKLGAFSFYPTKNLGALGDGGAVVTDDAALADRVRRLRNYGQTQRYQHAEPGMNSRLDEMQAAILRAKLPHLNEHNRVRRQIASSYHHQLNYVDRPQPVGNGQHVEHAFHLYVIRSRERDTLQEHLKRLGVGTLIHYPIPIHLQAAYRHLGYKVGSLSVTERVAREILSLPLYVGLTAECVGRVATAVNEWSEGHRHAKAA